MELLQWQSPLCCRLFPKGCVWLLVATLTLAGMMVVTSLISVILLLTEIEGAFAVDPTRGLWLGRSFLFFVGISPIYAIRIGHDLGFKRVFFVGCLIFLLGAIFTPFSTHYYEMLLCRIVGGLGGGVVVSVGLAIIARSVPDRVKAVTLAVSSSISFGLGIALGLLFGGYLAQTGHWQLQSVPDMVFAIPVVFLILLACPESPRPRRPPYDWVSFTSLMVATFALFLVFTQVKEPWNTLGWRSWFIIGCFATAAIALVVLVIATFTRKFPLFDHRFIKDPVFIVSCIGMGIVGIMIFGVALTSIGMLENIYLYEKWTVGWFLSSMGLIYCFGGIIPSLCVHRVSPIVFVLCGVTLITISCFVSHSITVQYDKVQLFIVLSMRATGVGFTLGPITAFALTDLPHDIAPRGAAIITFIRQMGGAFGSGIIQTIQITREAFHNLRFGEMVNVYSPRYQQYFTALARRATDEMGSGVVKGEEQATQLIITDILNQSKIASLVDAIWLFGWFFGALLVVMILLLLWHARRERIRTRDRSKVRA